MANKFLQSAKESLNGNKLMLNREKVSTDYIIERYPNGITITEFDFIVKADGTSYPILCYAEESNKYFNGGALFDKVCTGWITLAEGDIERASEELKQVGGVKFKLTKKRTKTGRTITDCVPID